MSRNRRSAFTLLEILLVIAILVILAGTGTVILWKQFDKGKEGIARTAVGPNGQIATALTSFKIEMGRFPTEEDGGLNALLKAPDGVEEDKAKKNWPMLQGGADGLKDPWGRPYKYKSPGDQNTDSYDLWSDGQNPNSPDDDITNWAKEDK